MKFVVRDYDDKLTTHEIGVGTLEPVRWQGGEEPKPQWLELEKKSGNGELLAVAYLISVHDAAAMTEIPFGDFPMRRGCHATLYQDAFCGMSSPHIVPNNAFEDIYRSLRMASHFIYITGWSVWTNLALLRDGPCELLGDLLKRKADEGVEVYSLSSLSSLSLSFFPLNSLFDEICIIVWDELTSVPDQYGNSLATEGMMGTFDEETRFFFISF